MKKILFIITFILVSTASWAVKAYPFPVTITQPDGTQLTIIGHGDEHFHWLTTTDGTLVVRQGNGYYVASVRADGTLSATTQLAHNKENRKVEETLLAKQQDMNLFFYTGKTKASKSRAKLRDEAPIMKGREITGSTYFPHKGTPKAVVILAQFKDVKFKISDPKKSFNQYLNGEKSPEDYGNRESSNYSSVAQYFKDMSYGQFVPQFDVYGPVTVSQNLAYYGGSDPNGQDEKVDELVEEACELVDSEVDFTQYPFAEGSKNVLVYVIYAGYGQSISGNSNDCLWAKSWGGISKTFDGMRIARCGINNELNGYPGAFSSAPYYGINGIGLFCHEFSHCMGMPDFYPTVVDAHIDNQALEFWSLMDTGEYTRNGYYPTAYTAWEREAFGWLEIETLTENQQGVELVNLDRKGKAYRIYNDNDASQNEYYIVQNIEKAGWNTYQYGQGMLVFHVNYDANAFSLTSNSVNNKKGSPRMTIVPADGILYTSYSIYDETDNPSGTINRETYLNSMAGDTYPGSQNVTTLSDESNLVNFKPYQGSQLNKFFTNITETDNVVTFDFYNGTPSSIQEIDLEKEQNSRRIFTLDGRYAGNDLHALPKGIYVVGKRKILVK